MLRSHIVAARQANASRADAQAGKLEAQLADLKARWPAHSVRPAMLQELEELEEQLEKAKQRDP